jgi:hypothetical protein
MPARTLALPCALLFALLAAPAPAAAGGWGMENWTKRPSAWTGHGAGSMVHRRTTAVTSMPGMPAPQKTVTEEKQTLLRETEDAYVIKVERLVMGAWTTTEETEPKVMRVNAEADISDLGEEAVTVAGTSYPCHKKQVKNLGMKSQAAPGAAATTGILWVNDTHGVLKMEMTMSMMGQAMTTTILTTKLSASHTVGDVTLDCREMQMSSSAMAGGVTTMLQCMDVPGQVVRMEMKQSHGPVQMEHVTELLAYVRK